MDTTGELLVYCVVIVVGLTVGLLLLYLGD